MAAPDSQNSPHEDPSAGLTEGLGGLNVADDTPPKTEEEYAQSQLTLRAIVSSREAGVIIGKAGKNVAELREQTGVKAGVSKVIPGVHERVLTVTGSVEGVAKVRMASSAVVSSRISCMNRRTPSLYPNSSPPIPPPPSRLTPLHRLLPFASSSHTTSWAV